MAQLDQVKKVLESGAKNIKEITEETKILSPNIRRILGQGTLKGIFKRESKGLYSLIK